MAASSSPDDANSPHRLLARTRAHYHFGIAANHGWMIPDVPPFNAAQAERGWSAMLELFGATLR